MNLIKTVLDGAFIIEPDVHGDNRGWFMESYNRREFLKMGINTEFVQDNKSFSQKKGTLRGLHCQKHPMEQCKLVSCARGAIRDVIVDIRHGSPSYMQWTDVELSEENNRMLYIPAGFLHGFVTLTDNVILSYKVDRHYSPENDRSVKFDDPVFGIDWGNDEHTLSCKDLNAPLYSESDVYFEYKKSPETINI